MLDTPTHAQSPAPLALLIDALTRFERPGQAELRIVESVCKFAGAAAGELLNFDQSVPKERKLRQVCYCKYSREKFDAMMADLQRVVAKGPMEIFEAVLASRATVMRHIDVYPQWYETVMYKEFVRKNGFDDTGIVVCRNDRGETTFAIAMSFEAGTRFSPETMAQLEELAPLIGRGLSNLQEWHGFYTRKHAVDLICDHAGDSLAVVELAHHGPRLLAVSAGARRLLDLPAGSLEGGHSRDFLRICADAARPDGPDAAWKASNGRRYRLRAETTPPLSIAPTIIVRFDDRSGAQESGFAVAVARYKGLSQREAELMELVAQGKADKEIAKQLHVSIHTIRAHLRNIYEKLGVSGRIAAIHTVYGEPS